MAKYEILPIFSSPVYVNEIEDIDFKKYLNLSKKYKWRLSGEKEELKNLSLASEDLNILEKKEFKTLKQRIMKEFNIFKNDVMKYKNDFKITTSWLTLSKKNQYSKLHKHTNCMFSGILYLNTNEKDGNLYFENVNNRSFFIVPEEYNFYNTYSFNVIPKIGRIVFFPSELYHKIELNKTNSKRISLAFNFLPKGEIGGGDSYLTL